MNPGKENKSNSLLGDAWRVLKKNKAAATSAWVMVVMGLMVIIGPLVSPFALDQTDWYQISAQPGLASGHILGPTTWAEICLLGLCMEEGFR